MNSTTSPQSDYTPTGRSAFFTSLVLLLLFFTYCYVSLPHSRAAGVKTEPVGVTNSRSLRAPGVAHVLAASYYSLKEGLDAKVMVSNQGPSQMPVSISLFSPAGERLDLEPFVLSGNEVRAINLRDRVPANSAFEEGSVKVTYNGMALELGGVVVMVDTERSLIFDEEFSEPAKDFRSSRLEGVWWIPSESAAMRLALSNSSDSSLTATVIVSGAGNSRQRAVETLALSPHETRLIKVQELLRGRFGGISIEHSGAPGALLARALIQEPSVGFSSVVEFRDPARAKTSRLDGTGLRLGNVLEEKLRPVAVARNVSSELTVLSGRVRYSTQNGVGSVITLPDIKLEPGEAKEVNLHMALNERAGKSDMTFAGLEFQYTGMPGSVVMSALSVSDSGNQVFRCPLVDAKTLSSSTGNYPWSISGSSSSVVYVKNVTTEAQNYSMQIGYAGGIYRIGLHTLGAGETVVVDVLQLRDGQVPDQFGKTIPLDAVSGQIHWSVVGSENHVLIGRLEQLDIKEGLSMTAACTLCCPDSFYSSWLTPSSVSGFIGDTTQFTATRQDVDCYGQFHEYNPNYGNWSSDDSGVATCDNTGFATAQGVGSTLIRNVYYATTWTPVDNDYCTSDTADGTATASCDVRPRIDDITPTQGPIDSLVGISIVGSGFGTSPSVIVSGTGITASGQDSSETSISVTLNISVNAGAGNHGITVTANRQQSNSLNFFVQIPTKLRRDSMSGLQAQQGGCGATRSLQYRS